VRILSAHRELPVELIEYISVGPREISFRSADRWFIGVLADIHALGYDCYELAQVTIWARDTPPQGGVSALNYQAMQGPNRTNVYVDGFNLYYGSLKRTAYKWLDILALCKWYAPNYNFQRIYYFTAIVGGTAKDPGKHIRQRAYLDALKTIPIVEIVEGHFLTEPMDMPLADGSGDARVLRSKEKASDVNLVTQLMWDAHCNNFSTAIIISGDSDFIKPVQMVRTHFQKEVIVFDCQRDGDKNSRLNKAASEFKAIRETALAGCQFPTLLAGANRPVIRKPPTW
jgi:uncharacterized LabA/DUF88 family protein